ncbi:ADH3 [Cyberlindnera jadinii]|uniref:alcohol dehydrogenase n=1 Tax=Cyberlindnera jadinii (strain ATCC 18201 / CBS 1600 / BCRC 20928 / JCM 3617 / NBRC 0987 / NRRL Y-1542) TaxID=983966 RepID=A0A0H5CJP1_CYBJN|nr:GroES-like protein [Cyberlindnera jadinii NRRL Y-1542]ODV72545.1 GroES-like protein [Cyberlindnera jadinii NRRL Y-1542]CEP24724.1 ADH3 [Cyberlindnera jadinii]
MSIPKTQKAVLFREHNGPLLYTDVPVPEPSDTEILIRLSYSGVCHSDLHAWRGDWPDPTILPLIGGHEGAGEVVAIGSAVKNFKVGDLAGVKWINRTCLTCEYCLRGEETCCMNQDISGYTVQGTFQQYVVADAIQAAKIPPGADLAEVAPLLCAGLTAYKALKKANLQQGEWCAIIGAGGGLGSYAVQFAKAMGFRVIAIDAGNKSQMIKDLGAEVFIDFTQCDDLAKEVERITDGGAHGVINFSVSSKAMNVGIKYVRTLGTFVIVGMPANAVIESNVGDHVNKQFNITASSVGTRAQMEDVLSFYSRGLVKSKIQVFPLSQLSKVYEMMEKNKLQGRAVVDNWR